MLPPRSAISRGGCFKLPFNGYQIHRLFMVFSYIKTKLSCGGTAMRSKGYTRSGVIAALILGAVSPRAMAAPDEIQVYTEEMDDPGQSGLELHLNYTLKGATEPAVAGEMQSYHRL